MAIRDWLQNNRETYFGNAAALRDYRTQLRGAKPIFLWSAYLLILICIEATIYGTLTRVGTLDSPAFLQQSLSVFYYAIMGLLGGAIVLIAPALTAAAVAGERQRKSLDLVLTTPIESKYYLVGKLIASYRYTWMLLILALPIASTCVVLGGATWLDVLYAFIYLSLFGLLFTSAGLLISVLAPKPISAIVYTYTAVFIFIVVFSAGLGPMYSVSPSLGGAGSPQEVPVIATLSPFLAGFSGTTHTLIANIAVPNWILFAAIVFAMSKLFLLGAASALSQYNSRETKSLRIHGLVYAALVSLFFGNSLMVSAASSDALGYYIGWFTVALHWLIPFASCYSQSAERKFHNDGLFSLKGVFVGTPSGGLPYMFMLIVATVAGCLLGAMTKGYFPASKALLHGVIWSVGFTTLFWSLARFASAMSNSLTAARGLTCALYICVLLLPLAFLQMASVGGDTSVWKIYPLYPLRGQIEYGMTSGSIMIALGAVIAAFAHWNDVASKNRREVIA